ncbi:hypothetical protein [Virgisporangium aurantiacum]|uniref:DUF5302 domain-containing protein n=1 Tax=Virgisporangium aurantiacum TaxID=175570 RepID=A0A8J3ZB77_9ACTN|nr:hypothetical protein [Virgisporangium aurantiacum]GIJ60572.1 hypothetical protein Vau01_080880 [Virgisporangium aurantiacum]
MPANPSSSEAPDEASNEAEAPAEPLSRAERRAAARGKTIHHDGVPVWNQGKVGGARGAQSARRNFTSRRSGG